MAGFVTDDVVVEDNPSTAPGFKSDGVTADERDEGNEESTGIGAFVFGVAGAIAGAVLGAGLGPVGAFIGGWIGGILGGVAGETAEQAANDIFDDDDTTQWNRLSESEKNSIIETALLEIALGWIPGGGGAAISKSASRKYGTLVEKVKLLFGKFLPRAGKELAEQVLDSAATVVVAKHISKMHRKDKKIILDGLVDQFIKEVNESGGAATMKESVKESITRYGYGNAKEVEKMFAKVGETATGLKAIDDWYKAELTAKIRAVTGILSLIRGTNVDINEVSEGWHYANTGGLIATAHPIHKARMINRLISM